MSQSYQNPDALKSWLKLVHAPGIGPATAHKLLEHFGDIASIAAANGSQLRQAGLREDAIDNLLTPQQTAIDTDLTWLEQAENRHIVSLDSRHYPALLKQIARPPLVLYVLGDVEVLHTPQLAMVGSRKASSYGTRHAARLAAAAASNGLTVCSGLAHGIDAAAHQGALQAGGLTVAVTATGLDRVYPAAHRTLARQICEAGALVSEFPIGTNPRAAFFPRRNRIISGLSYGLLVVEASLKSGSLTSAAHATEQSREVFAIPGNIDNPQAKGCHDLLRRGATLVEDIDDILTQLGPVLPSQLSLPASASGDSAEPPDTAIASGPPANGEAAKLLALFEYEPLTIDDLVDRSSLPISRVNELIIELELNGNIESTTGGGYIQAPD